MKPNFALNPRARERFVRNMSQERIADNKIFAADSLVSSGNIVHIPSDDDLQTRDHQSQLPEPLDAIKRRIDKYNAEHKKSLDDVIGERVAWMSEQRKKEGMREWWETGFGNKERR